MMDSFQHEIIARAIDELIERPPGAAPLELLAEKFGYDPSHFQKMFRERVGISPKRFTQFLTYRRARDFLCDGHPTLDAAYAAGLSSGGRLHDLFVACEAATPGAVRSGGQGLEIEYGFQATPLGDMLIAQTALGVCWASFVIAGDRDGAMIELARHWPRAAMRENEMAVEETAEAMFDIWRGDYQGQRLKLHLHGTNFQIQVWRALLKIPAGSTVSYSAVASALGMPGASRAAGSAIGANKIALLIPCHRVIQQSGIIEHYAWGPARKRLLLGLEAEHIAHRVEAGRLAV